MTTSFSSSQILYQPGLAGAIDLHLAGRLQEADQAYRALLQQQAEWPEVWSLFGALAVQGWQAELGVQRMRYALKLAPLNLLALTTLASTLSDLGEPEQALALFQQAHQLDPGNWQISLNLVRVLLQLMLADQAIRICRQILVERPELALVHHELGLAWLAKQQFDEAESCFQTALALQPDFADARNNLGVALKNLKRYDEALSCYRQALQLRPDFAKALFNLATIYFIRKDFETAKIWYQRSLAIDPQQIEAHQNMASMLLDQGQLAAAKLHRDAAYSGRPYLIDQLPGTSSSVLILWAAGKGNIPIDYLFPKQRYRRIIWMLEYADTAAPPPLDQVGLVFNAIGDPDVIGPVAEPMAAFLSNNRLPLLNDPEQVEATRRDRLPLLLQDIEDVLCPPTLRIATDQLRQALMKDSRSVFPLLIRPANSHGGDHLEKIDHLPQLLAIRLFPSEFYYLTPYIDYRSADGFFRKYRMAFIDRQAYPYHLGIGAHWMVHYETADMLAHPWKLSEEQAYLDDPSAVLGASVMRALREIAVRLDLDFCGIDFSVLPDGRLLVFEANATMLIHPEPPDSVIAHKNPYVQRIFEAFNRRLAQLA